jgi:hypothetical protein
LARRTVLLTQLPIPPAGSQPVEGNVPLAAAYLKLLAERRGLGSLYDIQLLPPALADRLGDQALLDEILAREPAVVGFTCYAWNVERTLWLCKHLRLQRDDLHVIVGGPEITADNAWVFDSAPFHYAAIGEGEQTFCDLLSSLAGNGGMHDTPGLAVGPAFSPARPRTAIANLDEVSSPYLAGILETRDTLFLETARGCRFKCKFCYYPKGFSGNSYLSEARVRASLRHAVECGVGEVFLLDPTLNQRRDFSAFLQLLADENRARRLRFSAELRAEGIDTGVARQLAEAGFAEVEIGLQSVDPCTQQLIGRRVDLEAFRRGTRALLDAGIRTQVDLIVGLPGDTADSIRRGIDFVVDLGASRGAQVFNLSILPGTALRHEAAALGLQYQSRPPYYVLETPSLDLPTIAQLMDEAQQAFGVQYDPAPLPTMTAPVAAEESESGAWHRRRVDLDSERLCSDASLASRPAHAALLWLASRDFHARRQRAAQLVGQLLSENPFTSLDVVFDATAAPHNLSLAALSVVHAACFGRATYLDRLYSVQSGCTRAAKRLIALLPAAARSTMSTEWIAAAADYAIVAWCGDGVAEDDLAEHEVIVPYPLTG